MPPAHWITSHTPLAVLPQPALLNLPTATPAALPTCSSSARCFYTSGINLLSPSFFPVLSSLRPKDHVVACTGGMVPMGALSTITREGFETATHDRVLGQLYLAQVRLP